MSVQSETPFEPCNTSVGVGIGSHGKWIWTVISLCFRFGCWLIQLFIGYVLPECSSVMNGEYGYEVRKHGRPHEKMKLLQCYWCFTVDTGRNGSSWLGHSNSCMRHYPLGTGFSIAIQTMLEESGGLCTHASCPGGRLYA